MLNWHTFIKMSQVRQRNTTAHNEKERNTHIIDFCYCEPKQHTKYENDPAHVHKISNAGSMHKILMHQTKYASTYPHILSGSCRPCKETNIQLQTGEDYTIAQPRTIQTQTKTIRTNITMTPLRTADSELHTGTPNDLSNSNVHDSRSELANVK